MSGDLQPAPPADDAVIGRALRYSLAILLVLGMLAASAYWWFTHEPPVSLSPAKAARAPVVAEVSAPAAPDIRFVDISVQAGIDFVHVNGAYGERLLPETMGGGVAFFDFDRDGDQDLLWVSGNYWPWDPQQRHLQQTLTLYRNEGSGVFAQVPAATPDYDGYGMGVAVADYDGDGFFDVYITALGSNRLFRNRGGLGFTEVTEVAGVAGPDDAWSSGAAFADFDGDADLDLVVVNYVQWSPDLDRQVGYQLMGVGRAYGPPTDFPGTQALLYLNRGDGTFVEGAREAGLHVHNSATGDPVAKSLAVIPSDVDRDGDMDLLVANDTTRNFLFLNRGNGQFDEVGERLGLAFDNAGKATGAMGIDIASLGPGAPLAVAIGNFANEMTSFYVSAAEPLLFSDDAVVAGIGPSSRSALSFGLFFFDVDLDGRLDLLQVNGHVENEIGRVQPSQSYAQAAQLFWHCGIACERLLGPVEPLGDLGQALVARGAAYADIDNDGDLDVAIAQNGRAAKLLRNDTAHGNWLRIALIGKAPNIAAIGARVSIVADGQRQQREIGPTRSYLSQTETVATFGLGNATRVDSVTVRWPTGQQQIWRDVAINRTLTLDAAMHDQ